MVIGSHVNRCILAHQTRSAAKETRSYNCILKNVFPSFFPPHPSRDLLLLITCEKAHKVTACIEC